jgi:hypothetical protein
MMVEIADLVGMLSQRAEALCAELLPHGVKEANEWRVGSVAGEPGRSMGVHLSGAKAGVWCDWAGRSDDRGDALDLVAKVLFAGDKRQALRWARAWLGIDRLDPKSLEQSRRQVEAKKRQAKADDQRNRDSALRLYLSSVAEIRGTLAERYLKGRGIDFAALGRQPRALRYHPGLVHPETGEIAPALVAAITDHNGHMVSVHRTFLERLPDGSVVKLRGVEDAKLTLGRYAGGCIRLWRGKSGRAWNEAQPGEWLLLGEGIEDTASGIIAAPEYRAAAAVSLGAMQGLLLPDAIEGVILLAQNDTKPKAIEALDRVIAHFHERGKRVRLARPDPSAKDVNELAQRALKQG